MKTVALFGVGLMGAPYASHLVAQGHNVHLYNRTRSKAEEVVGARVFDTPVQAARDCDVLFTVLADDRAVLDTVTAEVLEAMSFGGVHLSCGTVSVAANEQLAQRADQAGCEHLACPFLGRPDFVARKAHQFLLSGTSSKRDDIKALLQETCKDVIDFGSDLNAAVRAKLATNFLIASAIVSMGEAFSMLEKAGIKAEEALELWTSSLFNCPLYKVYGQKVLERDYQTPLFPLRLGLKDTRLIQEEAEAQGSPHELIRAVKVYFEQASEHGYGEMDWTGVTKEIR